MGLMPLHFFPQMQTIEFQLATAKELLSQAQTEYSHCFARGDWPACTKAKRVVAKRMREVQMLVAEKMALR